MKYAFLVLSVIAVACSYRSGEIHFVIPTGYEGPVVVARIEGSSAIFERTESGYSIVIQDNGIACVASLNPINKWHRLTGEYYNGETIYSRFKGFPSPPTPSAPRIEGVGKRIINDGPEEAWFVVGDEVQVIEFRKLMNDQDYRLDFSQCL